MVAPRRTKKVFCTVVRVPVTEKTCMHNTSRFSTRPSDLVPWADPYIAQLVTKLQHEVRSERLRVSTAPERARNLQAELDPPTPNTSVADWDWPAESRWDVSDEC